MGASVQDMGYYATSEYAKVADLPLKNRVGDFSATSASRALFSVPQTLAITAQTTLTVTITVSGRPVWPSRDPIGENGAQLLRARQQALDASKKREIIEEALRRFMQLASPVEKNSLSFALNAHLNGQDLRKIASLLERFGQAELALQLRSLFDPAIATQTPSHLRGSLAPISVFAKNTPLNSVDSLGELCLTWDCIKEAACWCGADVPSGVTITICLPGCIAANVAYLPCVAACLGVSVGSCFVTALLAL